MCRKRVFRRSYVCRIARNLAIKKYHSNRALKRNGNYELTLDELEEVSGGTIFQSSDRYGRPIYNVYNDRTNQFVASFYNLYEAVNCNLRTNG